MYVYQKWCSRGKAPIKHKEQQQGQPITTGVIGAVKEQTSISQILKFLIDSSGLVSDWHLKVTKREVCIAWRGRFEEGWRCSSLYVLLVWGCLMEGEWCKIIMVSRQHKRCERMDLQDCHSCLKINTIAGTGGETVRGWCQRRRETYRDGAPILLPSSSPNISASIWASKFHWFVYTVLILFSLSWKAFVLPFKLYSTIHYSAQ